SAGLNLLDFFLREYMKSFIYSSPKNNIQELHQRIQNATD
ncbi:hypothetical protein EAI_00053, partial [Harpegnathos saltator]